MRSMTGYGKGTATRDGLTVTAEIKTVNRFVGPFRRLVLDCKPASAPPVENGAVLIKTVRIGKRFRDRLRIPDNLQKAMSFR